jgi:hypothetical protein
MSKPQKSLQKDGVNRLGKSDWGMIEGSDWKLIE